MDNANDPSNGDNIASVGLPSAEDLSKVSANAGGGTNGLLMAIIALLGGGGAIWKYLQNREKTKLQKEEQAHEERMKELDIKATRISNMEEELSKCKAERDILQEKLDRAELKLAKAKSVKNK